MTSEEYHKIKALSAHGIITFLESPKDYLRKYIMGQRDEQFHVEGKDILGNVTDCMLTTPHEFNDRFDIMDVDAVGGKTGELILRLSETGEVDDEELTKMAKKVGLKKDLPWIKGQLNDKKSIEFLQQLRAKKDSTKVVTTTEMYNQGRTMKLRALEDKYIGHYFIDQPSARATHYYQVPIFFKFLGIQCKGLIDIVTVDWDTGKYYLSDLKTTSRGVREFPITMHKDRLFIQGAFYSMPHYGAVIDTPVLELKELFNRPTSGFMDVFSFVVLDSNDIEKPEEFWMHKHDIRTTIEGGKFAYGGDEFKGIAKCIKDLIWHMETNLWDHSRDYYEGKGHKLKLFE